MSCPLRNYGRIHLDRQGTDRIRLPSILRAGDIVGSTSSRSGAHQPMSECPPRSVLLVRPSALGDVCRTVPVLCGMREVWPDAHLGWLVQSEYVDAIRAHPALDEIIRFPRNQLRGAWKSPAKGRQLLSFLNFLRAGRCRAPAGLPAFARAFQARQRGRHLVEHSWRNRKAGRCRRSARSLQGDSVQAQGGSRSP